jgi:hypothetical protein
LAASENFAERAAQRHPAWPFLFGSERFGMANEDVYRCHVALSIPTNPQFGSLNLGAAMQVIAYEWRQALGGFAVQPSAEPQGALADAGQVAGMLAHWEQALAAWLSRPGRAQEAHAAPEPAFQPRATHAGGNPHPAWCCQGHAAKSRTGKALDFRPFLCSTITRNFMFARLRSDIQCILDRDPAARSTWEVLTCYPGLHAIWLHRPAHWCWTMASSGWGASSRTWRAGSRASRSTPAPRLASACSSTTPWAWWWARPPRLATAAPSTRA